MLTMVVACNGGLEPSPESGACPSGFIGACGTVTFRGAVPPNTQVVYVVAYEHFPQGINDLLLYQPLAPPTLDLPTGPADTTATYRLPLPAGHYEWILAVWKENGPLSFETADSLLREAGFYRNPLIPSEPGSLDIAGGRDSIDFVVDFNNMHRVSFYFPARAR